MPTITEREESPGACRDVLIRMLMDAREIVPALSGSATVRMQQTALLDAFVLAFCRELEAQLTQGLLRQYVARRENMSVANFASGRNGELIQAAGVSCH